MWGGSGERVTMTALSATWAGYVHSDFRARERGWIWRATLREQAIIMMVRLRRPSRGVWISIWWLLALFLPSLFFLDVIEVCEEQKWCPLLRVRALRIHPRGPDGQPGNSQRRRFSVRRFGLGATLIFEFLFSLFKVQFSVFSTCQFMVVEL